MNRKLLLLSILIICFTSIAHAEKYAKKPITFTANSILKSGAYTGDDPLVTTGITENSSGDITFTGDLTVGDGSSNANVLSNGNYDLILKTGNSTTGTITITDGANGDVTVAPNKLGTVYLTNTDTGALGSVLNVYHNSASPANSDVIARVASLAKDNGGNLTTFAKIDTVITDVTNTTEDADLIFYTNRAGTVTQALQIDSDVNGILVGDGSGDGIVQSKGNLDLILKTGNSTTGTITIADGSNGNFTLDPNGSGSVILANGSNVGLNDSTPTSLLTVNGALAFGSTAIVATTANGSIAATTRHADVTLTSNVMLDLPAVASVPGMELCINLINNGTAMTLTVNGNAAETVAGAATQALTLDPISSFATWRSFCIHPNAAATGWNMH